MRSWWVLLGVFLAGCGVVVPEDTAGTLSAQNRAFVTEAADIRGTLQMRETEVLATSIAAETNVAVENNMNAVLLATVRAGDLPTVAVRAQLDRSVGNLGTGGTPPAILGSGGGGDVVATYTTSAIRDADGCGEDQRSQFDVGTVRIFAVQEVQNIPANTLMGIEWFYNGSVALEDQLLVTEGADNLCVWFFVEPYSTGSWSVQFLANGSPSGGRVNFQVGE